MERQDDTVFLEKSMAKLAIAPALNLTPAPIAITWRKCARCDIRHAVYSCDQPHPNVNINKNHK